MVQFEVKVVLVGVWTKAHFFHHNLLGLGLHLLLLLLLLVEELFIVHHSANRRVSIGNDFNQVQFLFLGNLKRFIKGINARFNVFSYNAYLRYTEDFFINPVQFFFLLWAAVIGPGLSGWQSYGLVPPFIVKRLSQFDR